MCASDLEGIVAKWKHGRYYTDGGLRQNTPMSPAIRLGADRMLLVSLRHVAPQPKELQREHSAAFPKPLFLAGKALNALLLDHTEYDLARMQRINLILEAGAYELARRPDIPPRVTMSEYVGIAYAFFTGSEPGLANGVLDHLARTLRGSEL